MTLKSALPRSMYFTIPEQRLIFNCIQEYLSIKPNNKEARKIYDDFYRESWSSDNK